MRMVWNPAPFEQVLAQPGAPLTGRWQGLHDGDPIAVPAVRAVSPSRLALGAARAIIALLEGPDELRFWASTDPAFYVLPAPDMEGLGEIVVYRTRNEQVASSATVTQTPLAAIPFAMRLLTQGDSDLVRAYAAALAAFTSGADDSILLPLIATASDELVVAIAGDLNQEVMVWLYQAKVTDGDLEEIEYAGAIDLAPLFGDPAAFAAWRSGQATGFEALKSVPRP